MALPTLGPAPIRIPLVDDRGYVRREWSQWLDILVRSINDVKLGVTGQLQIIPVAGTPEGAVTAAPGSIALRTDGGAGTTFYVKEAGTGNTGWVQK